ncbi:ribonuclease HI [Agromyces sp. NPDC057679]|uniref:ribonuclease HI n=1 Tax=Agromyces sp. NPDC057679 TaxID=3346207 RepID=UPI00367148CD
MKKTKTVPAKRKYGMPLHTHVLNIHLGAELDDTVAPLTIAADGSFDHRTGHGAYAWISERGRYRTGEVRNGDSVIAELTALAEAVEYLSAARAERAVILTDCRLAISAIAQVAGGAKAPKRNRAVRLATRVITASAGRDVEIRWVRGHADHQLNNAADRLANVEMCARRNAVDYDGVRKIRPQLQRYRDLIAKSLHTDLGYELVA